MPVSLISITPGIPYVNSVYGDTNLFCYARSRTSQYYQPARTILADLIIQHASLFISDLVIDEMWWAFLRVWYRSTTGQNLTARRVKRNPSILRRFAGLIQRNTDKTLRLPNLTVITLAQPLHLIQEAKAIYMSENLMPRDCFHLAYVIRNNIEGFITSDSDFDNLSLPNYNLTVYKY